MHKMRFIFVLVAVFSAIQSSNTQNVQLSNYIELCELASQTRDECLRRSFESLARTYPGGIQEVGLPAFDPLVYKSLKFNFNSPLLFISSLVIKDMQIRGFSKVQFLSVKTKFNKNTMRAEMDVFFPDAFIEGNYRGNLRFDIGYIPQGRFNVTAVQTRAKLMVEGKLETINGEQHMIMNKFSIWPEFGDMKTNVEGLFPHKSFNDLANNLINANWRLMTQTMIQEVNRRYEPIFLNMANVFFRRFPFSTMFI